MPRILSWHPWPARNWPATATEEAAFVTGLRELATGHRRPADRNHIIAVMNALRSGVPLPELLTYIPGSRPEDLLTAYDHIDTRRQLATVAWQQILDQPTPAVILENASTASRILPVPVAALATRCGFDKKPILDKIAVSVTAEINHTRNRVRQVEADLQRHKDRPEAAIELGRALFDPYNPGLWAHSHFLPERVGELTPVRLADILGERPT